MNRFLDRLARLYAPLGRRGLLMDGQYLWEPLQRRSRGSGPACDEHPSPLKRLPQKPPLAGIAQTPSTRTLA